MSYIKFIGDDTQYTAKVMPFTTQHSIKAVRIISEELPVTETGFYFYNDNDEIIGDYSEYIHHYENNSYSVEKDNIVYGGGSDAPLPISILTYLEKSIAIANNNISRVDKSVKDVANDVTEVEKEVIDITPYVETKTAYIDDTEIIFEVDKQGVISVNAVNRNNETVPVTYEKDGNKIIVLFDPLEEVTNVTIQIQ